MAARARSAPLAAAALALAAVLGGCGGTSDRDRVRDYIEAANAIQRQAAPDVQAAGKAYAQFARHKLSGAAAVRRLTAAEDALTRERDRIRGLHPPQPARALHQRLLDVFDADVGLASEATALARYVPAAARVLHPLAKAGQQLQRDLRHAGAPDAQRRALTRYAAVLGRLEDRLRELSPPPVLVASHRAQLLRLLETRALSRRLADAVRRRDAAGVARLLLRFREVNGVPRGQQRVAREAARAYGRRVDAVGAAVAALQRERARLDATLD